MCYAILRVSYKNGTEPLTLKEISDPSQLADVTKELMGKSGVQKVTSFLPYETTELVSEWKSVFHAEENT